MVNVPNHNNNDTQLGELRRQLAGQSRHSAASSVNQWPQRDIDEDLVEKSKGRRGCCTAMAKQGKVETSGLPGTADSCWTNDGRRQQHQLRGFCSARRLSNRCTRTNLQGPIARVTEFLPIFSRRSGVRANVVIFS